jgi:hypothetical protein
MSQIKHLAWLAPASRKEISSKKKRNILFLLNGDFFLT